MASSAASQPPGESLRDIFTRARHVACDEPLPASLAPDEPYATMQALRDMDKAHAMVNSLDLFSTNESIEDVATRDLMYLLAPHYMSLAAADGARGHRHTALARRLSGSDYEQGVPEHV